MVPARSRDFAITKNVGRFRCPCIFPAVSVTTECEEGAGHLVFNFADTDDKTSKRVPTNTATHHFLSWEMQTKAAACVILSKIVFSLLVGQSIQKMFFDPGNGVFYNGFDLVV